MPLVRHLLVPILALAALPGGCAAAGDPGGAASSEPAAVGEIVVRGELTRRGYAPLPPDARAVVELRDLTAGEGVLLAEQRIALRGGQPPVAFELRADASRMEPERRYAVRAAIFHGGRPAWVSEPATVPTRSGSFDLGRVSLSPASGLAFASTWRCGTRDVTVGHAVAGMRMLDESSGTGFDLQPARTASGARFDAVGDPSTWFWNKGPEASVSLRGALLERCVPAAALEREAADRLAVGVWSLEELDGRSLVDGSRATLRFATDGTLSGMASCNRYTARWRPSGGAQLALSARATTMRACAPALAAQEESFLGLLKRVSTYATGSDGTLVLSTPDGSTLRARR
jgi:heat shock protein HslJ/uncharacterized lipoprotein YbaY